jgi:predicted dehydrogenase
MDPVRIGIIGCGDITRSHLWGYWSAAQCGRDDFRIVALCSRSRKHSEQYFGRHISGSVPAENHPGASPQQRSFKAGRIGVGDLPHAAGDPAYLEDWRELLKRPDIDLVDIHLPPAMHHAVAVEALRAGKHVIVEKPLALTVRGGLAVTAAAKAAGKVVGVGHNLRFDPAVRSAQWLVESGRLGAVRFFHTMTLRAPGHWRRPVDSRVQQLWHRVRDRVLYWKPGVLATPLGSKWRYQLAGCGAGELSENGIHLVDLARVLGGEIGSVYGALAQYEPVELPGPEGRKVGSEVADTFLAVLRFRSGAFGQIALSAAMHGEANAARMNFLLHGDQGSITEERHHLKGDGGGNAWELFRAEAPRDLQERWFPGGLTHRFGLQKLDVLDAVRAGQEPEASGEQALRSLAACCAVAESSELRREVTPDEVLALKVTGFQDPIDRVLGLLPPEGAAPGASAHGAERPVEPRHLG